MTFRVNVSQTGGNNYYAGLVYTDDAQDYQFLANPAGWSGIVATVGAGNVGKAIKSVFVHHDQGAHSEQRWFAIDNARIITP